MDAFGGQLPLFNTSSKSERVHLFSTFIQQHHRSSQIKQASNVGVGVFFGGVVLEFDPAGFEALSVHFEQGFRRFFFGRAVRVDDQSCHARGSRLAHFNPLENEQVHEPQQQAPGMGWWPFGKRKGSGSNPNDPILKDTRTWLAELRDACEMNFDQPEEARRQIRQMQVEWMDAQQCGDMAPSLREGLEARAFRLLTCNDKEWLAWLDNLDFWKAGWRPDTDENEP